MPLGIGAAALLILGGGAWWFLRVRGTTEKEPRAIAAPEPVTDFGAAPEPVTDFGAAPEPEPEPAPAVPKAAERVKPAKAPKPARARKDTPPFNPVDLPEPGNGNPPKTTSAWDDYVP